MKEILINLSKLENSSEMKFGKVTNLKQVDLSHKMWEYTSTEESYFMKIICEDIEDVEIIKMSFSGRKDYISNNITVYYNIDDIIENVIYISKRYRDFEAEKEEELEEWAKVTMIEKVATFVSDFMKATDIKFHEIISKIMDFLNENPELFENLEFKNIEFKKITDPIEFSKEIILEDHSRSHSWAGSEGTEETGYLLYSSDSKLEFGIDYENEHSNNGQSETSSDEYEEGNFNIDRTYVILKKKEGWFHYNNNGDTSNDYVKYECIAYVGDDAVYQFEHEEIIKKYEIDKKVLERNVLNEN